MFSNNKGFTFIELIVVVIINSVIIFTVGIILLQSQTSWQKGFGTVELGSDYRYCRIKLEIELRKATNAAITLPARNEIRFVTITGDTETCRLNGNFIELRYASTGKTEVLLRDVSTLQFSFIDIGQNVVRVDINQQRVTDFQTNAIITSANNFLVRCRNKF